MARPSSIAHRIQQELKQRTSSARDLMKVNGLDALLFFTGPTLFYFSGMPCIRSGSRPFVYLLPREGEPVLIVHAGRQFEARSFTGIGDIRTYTQLSCLPVEQLVSAIRDRNLLEGRIGLEMSGELVLDLPLAETLLLSVSMPHVELVDASSLVWKLRMVKSQFEIEQIARACKITSEAYVQTFGSIRSGMSEPEVERLMYWNMLKQGGGAPWVLITSGAGNYDLVSKGSSPRVLEQGDMVWMDVGCSVNGYWSDFSRACVIGLPSAEQEEAQRELYAITKRGVQMVRPGVPVAEIASFLNQAVEDSGVPITSNISGLASRVGHGLGLVVTELPSLNEQDPTRLQPGMVVTIEPGVATGFGTFHIEQNVLVTADHPHVLSMAGWRLSRTEVA